MPRDTRATDLGIRIGRFTPGPTDGITDVAGVRVAATTIVKGEGSASPDAKSVKPRAEVKKEAAAAEKAGTIIKGEGTK